MRDEYLYEDVHVLKNKLGIKNNPDLDQAESDITYVKLLDIDTAITGTFDYQRLKAIHKYIFEDIYEWAGEERTIPIVKGERVLGGDSIKYSQPNDIEKDMESAIGRINKSKWESLDFKKAGILFSKLTAKLWQVHPFREGNTRTVVTFMTQFAETKGFPIDKELLRVKSGYVRDALVMASDGKYADYSYLTRVVTDSMLSAKGLLEEQENLEEGLDTELDDELHIEME
jgi:cell filamentation protein